SAVERLHQVGGIVRPPRAQESDHRYRRLLRPRRNRPRCCAAEQRDELAAPDHVWMAPAWQEIFGRAAHRSLAVMCPASHDGFSVKGREGQQNVIQGGALIPAGFPAKPHIRWELIPTHCPAFGTGELQENDTTL